MSIKSICSNQNLVMIIHKDKRIINRITASLSDRYVYHLFAKTDTATLFLAENYKNVKFVIGDTRVLNSNSTQLCWNKLWEKYEKTVRILISESTTNPQSTPPRFSQYDFFKSKGEFFGQFIRHFD